jgi:hypothetical protein
MLGGNPPHRLRRGCTRRHVPSPGLPCGETSGRHRSCRSRRCDALRIRVHFRVGRLELARPGATTPGLAGKGAVVGRAHQARSHLLGTGKTRPGVRGIPGHHRPSATGRPDADRRGTSLMKTVGRTSRGRRRRGAFAVVATGVLLAGCSAAGAPKAAQPATSAASPTTTQTSPSAATTATPPAPSTTTPTSAAAPSAGGGLPATLRAVPLDPSVPMSDGPRYLAPGVAKRLQRPARGCRTERAGVQRPSVEGDVVQPAREVGFRPVHTSVNSEADEVPAKPPGVGAVSAEGPDGGDRARCLHGRV